MEADHPHVTPGKHVYEGQEYGISLLVIILPIEDVNGMDMHTNVIDRPRWRMELESVGTCQLDLVVYREVTSNVRHEISRNVLNVKMLAPPLLSTMFR